MFIDGSGHNWSGKNVVYKIRNIEEAMEINIKAEENAIKGYQNLIRHTNNMGLRRIYERIILDEQAHKKIFEMIKKEVSN